MVGSHLVGLPARIAQHALGIREAVFPNCDVHRHRKSRVVKHQALLVVDALMSHCVVTVSGVVERERKARVEIMRRRKGQEWKIKDEGGAGRGR